MTEPLYIDNSTLKAVAKCSTEAMLRYAYGWTTAEERAALLAGTAFHSLAEQHFKGAGASVSLGAFDATYREWSEANVSPTDRLAWGNLSRIVRRWIEAHPVAGLPFTVNPDLVEVGFAFPLVPDGSIVFCGRLDGVAEYQGSLYVLEHKTTGRISLDWLDTFALDSQLSGYLWAAQQHTGKPVVGAFLNALEFSKLPGGTTASGGPARKCPDHKVTYDECGDMHATFRMTAVTRTPAAIEEWYKTAIHLARRYQDMLARWPKIEQLGSVRTQGRWNGSCRFCGFKEFCKLDRPMHYIANGNLIHQPWRPYDRATLEASPTGHKP